MNRFPLRMVWMLALSMMAGCAESAGPRQLQSLSLSPATASANGAAVQFTATGHWSRSPLTETPMPATWGACTADASETTKDVTVSQTGMATCASGAKGTYDVFAYDPPLGAAAECNAITACGGGCTISGTAQITCP